MTNVVVNAIEVVVRMILGVGVNIVSQLKSYFDHQMQFVKGCKIDGKTITAKQFQELAAVIGKPFVLDSDEGKVIFCHGAPNGRFVLDPTNPFEFNATYQELIQYLGLAPGKYKLLSCFNGKREDYIQDGYQIIRLEYSKTCYPTMAGIFRGTLRLCSSKMGFAAYLMLQTPISYWRYIGQTMEGMINSPIMKHEIENGRADIGITGVERHIVTDPETIQKLNKLKEEGRFHF